MLLYYLKLKDLNLTLKQCLRRQGCVYPAAVAHRALHHFNNDKISQFSLGQHFMYKKTDSKGVLP